MRRYVYNDVVRLDDLQKLIDCAYVQVKQYQLYNRTNFHLNSFLSETNIYMYAVVYYK